MRARHMTNGPALLFAIFASLTVVPTLAHHGQAAYDRSARLTKNIETALQNPAARLLTAIASLPNSDRQKIYLRRN